MIIGSAVDELGKMIMVTATQHCDQSNYFNHVAHHHVSELFWTDMKLL